MMNKISNNPVLFLDWVLCCLFGFLSLCGFIAVFFVADKTISSRLHFWFIINVFNLVAIDPGKQVYSE